MRVRTPVAGAVLAGAVLVLAPGTASAHPNLIASGKLRAGEPTRLTLIILGDEGGFHGADVTFPVSFRLTDAHAIGAVLGTPTIQGQTVHLSGFDVPAGQIGQMYVDGTPTVTGSLSVTVVSQLDSGRDYRYPALTVQIGSAGGSSWTGKALLAGLIAVAGGLTGVAYVLRRRSHARRS